MSATTADVCVIGSGAGGGPVASTLAEAGFRVLVLEKGPHFDTQDFLKDEIAQVRWPIFTPRVEDEPQVRVGDAGGQAGGGGARTNMFWSGSLVGGSSVLMSGFFLRMKREDFKPLSTFGKVEGADVADWPLAYEDLEPWYARAEVEAGVSGRLIPLPESLADPRSTPAFPQPPLREHPFAQHLDQVLPRLRLHPIPLPRAILSRSNGPRGACDYNGYCGSYGCVTKAKSTSLHAFLERALATGRCEIRSRAMTARLESDATGAVKAAHYFDAEGKLHQVTANVFVVACQAIESARLLLNSPGPRHPNGLANRSGLVGRNLLFSGFGAGWGAFPRHQGGAGGAALDSPEPFVHRVVQDWRYYDPQAPERRHAGEPGVLPGQGMVPGGTLNFLLMHPNPIAGAVMQALWDERPESIPLWGEPLKRRLQWYFKEVHHLRFETFVDWLPHPRSRVEVSRSVKDRWGLPVARIQAFNHPRSRASVEVLVRQGVEILRALGAERPRAAPDYGGPSTNLVAGTCRFGEDPARSVLDPFCRAHDVPNLYVTDGSCFPSGGSVPYTFTIYANALRVADHLVQELR